MSKNLYIRVSIKMNSKYYWLSITDAVARKDLWFFLFYEDNSIVIDYVTNTMSLLRQGWITVTVTENNWKM